MQIVSEDLLELELLGYIQIPVYIWGRSIQGSREPYARHLVYRFHGENIYLVGEMIFNKLVVVAIRLSMKRFFLECFVRFVQKVFRVKELVSIVSWWVEWSASSWTDIETWTICSTNGKPVPVNSMFWVRRTNLLSSCAWWPPRLYSRYTQKQSWRTFNPSLVRSEDFYINLVYMAHLRQAAFCTRGRFNSGRGLYNPKKMARLL